MNEQVALLPHLTDEELEQIQLAVGTRYYGMQEIARVAQAPEIRRDAQRAATILSSLMTAVAETRQQLQRTELREG